MSSLLRFLPASRRQESSDSDDAASAIPEVQVDVKQEKSGDSDSEELQGTELSPSGLSLEEDAAGGMGRHLGVFSCTLLIVGKIIGTGIFSTPSSILGSVGSVGASFMVWVAGFILSFCGLFIWLEFGTMIPRSGAEKVYLEAVYKKPKYLVTVIFAANAILLGFTASGCIVFAQNILVTAGHTAERWVTRGIALGVIVFVTLLHGLAPKLGVWVMNGLSISKILILIFIVITGWAVLAGHTPIQDPHANFRDAFAGSSHSSNDYATAMFKVLFSYAGWSNVNNVMNDVKNPIRTLKIAGPLGLAICAVLYLLANVSYFAAATKEEIRTSGVTVASLFFGKVFGEKAQKALSFFVALSALGNVVTVTFAAARVNQELAKEGIPLPFGSKFWASNWPTGKSPLPGDLAPSFHLFQPCPQGHGVLLDSIKMAVARLNEDVLTIICEFLTDVSHILSFALTCSALHPIAIRHLLSMRPVYLTGSASIHQFHSFVFADKLARARHIRALEIGTRPRLRRLPEATPADDDSLLIDILNLCPRLERISVVLRVRRTDDRRISDVIAAIQSLRSLSVHGKLADTVAFFHQIRAPLRMFGIHCRNPRGGHWSPAALEDFLPRFASTLEELELESFQSDPNQTQTQASVSTPSRSVFSMTQYPAVRSFSVIAFIEMPALDHLQHLFPALDGTLSLSTFGIWTNEHLFAGVRAANQRAQESERDSPPSRAWKKLDRVVCNVFMFYVLGLRCPVRLVMLDSGSAYRKRYIAAALRENPVPRLKLSLRLSHGLGVFEGLFPPELGGTLTHLTLFCEDDQYARDADAATIARRRWDDLFDKMSSSLQPLHNLTHLRVVFHSSTYHADFSPDAHGEEYLRAVRGPAFELAEETVASLVCPLPSLEYIFLTTAGYLAHNHGSQVYERWHVARAWRVTEPPTDGMKDGRPVLVGLHDEVAETIIRKEELVLSKEDEEVLRKYEDQQ